VNFRGAAERLGAKLKSVLPKQWDGRECITSMRDQGCRNWKQMEWMGFYFQFLCETKLADMMRVPGPRYGKTGFDGFYEIPWDFKAHAMNTSSHEIVVNDSEATSLAIGQYGAVGLILALGKVVYNDEARTFQAWHQTLKGAKSRYMMANEKRGAWSRLRKVSFDLQQVSFIRLTDKTLVKCGSFQTDFRNSNGQPRRPKVLINLERLKEETVYFVEF
jgi:hypothetical protein